MFLGKLNANWTSFSQNFRWSVRMRCISLSDWPLETIIASCWFLKCAGISLTADEWASFKKNVPDIEKTIKMMESRWTTQFRSFQTNMFWSPSLGTTTSDIISAYYVSFCSLETGCDPARWRKISTSPRSRSMKALPWGLKRQVQALKSHPTLL